MHCPYCGKQNRFQWLTGSSGFCNSVHRRKYEQLQGASWNSGRPAPPKGRIIDLRPDPEPVDIPQRSASLTVPPDFLFTARVGRGLVGTSFRGILKHPVHGTSESASRELRVSRTTLGPLQDLHLSATKSAGLTYIGARLFSIGSSVCRPSQARLRSGEKLMESRVRLATREGSVRLRSAELAQTERQFLLPPEPANERSAGWEPILSIQLASFPLRMGPSVAHLRAGLSGANPLVRVQAAGSTRRSPRDTERCFLKGSPHLPGTNLRLSHQLVPGSGRLFDLGRLTPALPSLGAPAALSEQQGSRSLLRMGASRIPRIGKGAPKSAAFLKKSGAFLNRIPNPHAILMEVAPSSIVFLRTAVERSLASVGPTNTNVARAPQLLGASIAPAISPTPDAASFLPLRTRNLAIPQPRWKRPDPQRAPFAVLLPPPVDSAVRMVSAESGHALQKWQLARYNWSAGMIRERGKLRAGEFLRSEIVHAVPIEPLGESFHRTRLPSTPPPVAMAPRWSRFFPLVPQESVLDDQVRELAQRVLDPALLQLVQIRFPDYDLKHSKPTMHRCVDWLPIGSRWQRRRRVWDRGARWKVTKRAVIPSGSLTISPAANG